GLLHGLAESDASRRLERQLVRVHIVVRAVIEDDAEVHHREARKVATLRRLDNSLLHRRNVVFRNRAAEDFVDKFEVPAVWQRFHLDFAVAELAMAAALLLVASL